MAATLTWSGLDVLQAVLRNTSPRATQFLTESMEEVSIVVFNESQRLVPVDTGALKSSGHVDPPDVAPGNIVINIGYGGVAADYALRVHEDLAMRHAAPTQAKFLEQPMAMALDSLNSRVAGRMEAALLGGTIGGAPNSATATGIGASSRSSVNRRSQSRSRSMSHTQVTAALEAISRGSGKGATFRAGRNGNVRMKF